MAIPQPDPRGYPGNLGLLFAEHAQSDRPAIVDLRDPKQPRPVSFRELDAGCNAVARGLARAGIKPGDRIGILSLNRAEFVMALLGAMRAGVVPVPTSDPARPLASPSLHRRGPVESQDECDGHARPAVVRRSVSGTGTCYGRRRMKRGRAD